MQYITFSTSLMKAIAVPMTQPGPDAFIVTSRFWETSLTTTKYSEDKATVAMRIICVLPSVKERIIGVKVIYIVQIYMAKFYYTVINVTL